MIIGQKQKSADENAAARVKRGSKITSERPKADPPDPPDPSFSPENLRIKESATVELAMASKVHTAGLSTSTKVLVLNSKMVKRQSAEMWI